MPRRHIHQLRSMSETGNGHANNADKINVLSYGYPVVSRRCCAQPCLLHRIHPAQDQPRWHHIEGQASILFQSAGVRVYVHLYVRFTCVPRACVWVCLYIVCVCMRMCKVCICGSMHACLCVCTILICVAVREQREHEFMSCTSTYRT